MVPIIPIIFAIRALAGGTQAASQGIQVPQYATTSRSLLWPLIGIAWLIFSIVVVVDTAELHHWPGALAAFTLAVSWVVVLVGAAALFFAWPILRRLARLGRPKLVYYLAHVVLLFPRTGETYSGACVLASLALAHRGASTPQEREWVKTRIAKERRHLGTYATACALHQMLEARAARDEGRIQDAYELGERARTLLGTITYLSPRGIPGGVRKVAYELLALDDARNGRWGFLELVPEKSLTPVARVLRAFGREKLGHVPTATIEKLTKKRQKKLDDAKKRGITLTEKDLEETIEVVVDRKAERIRRSLASPILDALFVRPTESVPPQTAHSAWIRTRKLFLALMRGEPVGPRALMNLLVGFDMLLHPENPETLLPEEIKSNAEITAEIHDEIAKAIAPRLLAMGAPLYLLNIYGPISARVYQYVETELFGEMDRVFKALQERFKLDKQFNMGMGREDPFTEWCRVSSVRALYRRAEMHLGTAAVARIYPVFAHRYCNLGVELSEHYPRMRPLAHAVFKCLSGEAARFNDAENIKQQAHNMLVTSGVD